MKKGARTYVLEQDEHLQNLRKIIKRDFFSGSDEKQETIQLSLNDYIKNFKSNENQTFSQLVMSDKQKWKSQHWWIDKQDKILMLQQEKLAQKRCLNNQYQNMINQMDPKCYSLAITNQQAKNSIFFNKDTNSSYLSQEHQTSKKIFYNNTRIEKIQKIYQKQQEQEQQGVMITWGQVDGTPIRIDSKSQYRIPDRPQNDQILDKLNDKMSKNKKSIIQNNKKSELMLKIMGSSAPSYRKSSFVRNSSIRRVNVPCTPLVIQKDKIQTPDMKNLLKFEK